MFRRSIPAFLLANFIIYEHLLFSNGQVLHHLEHAVADINLQGDCAGVYPFPTNDFCSIQYLLFTPSNQDSPCYFEPNCEEFNDCPFDSNRETKVLIHGYNTKLLPGNQFEQIKDALLSTDDYNVIIVGWTHYNQGLYEEVAINVQLVGTEVAKLVNFLVDEKGANVEDIHIIGHSLGAHVAGIAGKNVENLGRVTGLDPPLYLFETDLTNRLAEDDANFVDVIHCSNGMNVGEGYGIPFPIGYMDFYPNGGDDQPLCQIGKTYNNSDNENKDISNPLDLRDCRHNVCLSYFLYSIQSCNFPSRQCINYRRYIRRLCSSNPLSRMGLWARKIDGIGPYSKFYLRTGNQPPFCLKKTKRTEIPAESDCD